MNIDRHNAINMYSVPSLIAVNAFQTPAPLDYTGIQYMNACSSEN